MSLVVRAAEVWTFFVTETKEDQQLLIDTFRNNRQQWAYRPNVACFEGNANAPITHPKGEARQFSRRAQRLAVPLNERSKLRYNADVSSSRCLKLTSRR